MYIFVYFYSQLIIPRDEIEDAIDNCLGNRGEVTGGGSGDAGSNIDIELYCDEDMTVVKEIMQVLKYMQVPTDTALVVDGERYNLYK